MWKANQFITTWQIINYCINRFIRLYYKSGRSQNDGICSFQLYGHPIDTKHQNIKILILLKVSNMPRCTAPNNNFWLLSYTGWPLNSPHILAHSRHGHDHGQWKGWINFWCKESYICKMELTILVTNGQKSWDDTSIFGTKRELHV